MREHSLRKKSINWARLKSSEGYLTYRFGIRFGHRIYLFQGLTKLALELDIVELQG